jgi:hypothetical protein
MKTETALKYDAEVKGDGQVTVNVPLAPGSKVKVFIVETESEFEDLVLASQSSLEFWKHPLIMRIGMSKR